jgi:hypothetical protein
LVAAAQGQVHASFVIATIIPIATNTTIAIWVQIQNGDMAGDRLPGRLGESLR